MSKFFHSMIEVCCFVSSETARIHPVYQPPSCTKSRKPAIPVDSSKRSPRCLKEDFTFENCANWCSSYLWSLLVDYVQQSAFQERFSHCFLKQSSLPSKLSSNGKNAVFASFSCPHFFIFDFSKFFSRE